MILKIQRKHGDIAGKLDNHLIFNRSFLLRWLGLMILKIQFWLETNISVVATQRFLGIFKPGGNDPI